jgi:hypothetical protein
MQRIELNSTGLQTAAYQGSAALLDLEFRGGEIYRYFDVPAQTYQELLLAESKGAYFNRHIRNRFRSVKIPRTANPSA